MTPAHAHAAPSAGPWLRRAEDWLDARGKGAWIALAVVGLIAFWPVGLAIVAYAIWSKRMSGDRTTASAIGVRGRRGRLGVRTTGNAAFDAYKSDMLRRLEEEQEAFETFLQRLREARDKAEFDQFMADRSDRDNERTDA